MESLPHNFCAKFIAAPDEYLASLENKEFGEYRFPKESLWIWPVFVTRGHVVRAFNLDGRVTAARLYLVCDNKFSAFFLSVFTYLRHSSRHVFTSHLPIARPLFQGSYA